MYDNPDAPRHKLPDHNSAKIKARDKNLTDVIRKLAKHGIVVQQCSPHHLKYSRLNFYPRRGIIHRDGAEAPYNQRGLDAFVRACFKEADIEPDSPPAFELLPPSDED